VKAFNDIGPVLDNKDLILFVVPSNAARQVASKVRSFLTNVKNKEKILFCHAIKGFEKDTKKRISEILIEELGISSANLAVLSGPSHAEEVILSKPTATVISSTSLTVAKKIQSFFKVNFFRVYTSDDVVGVEISGALKNILGIAAGLVDGLKLGNNAKAALIARGLNEIMRLGLKMGAKLETFLGLAGVGDIVVTCNSKHSRNWKAGHMLSKGKRIGEILKNVGMVVEGVKTIQTAFVLSKEYKVSMPITTSLYEVLFLNKDPSKVIFELMQRDQVEELKSFLN